MFHFKLEALRHYRQYQEERLQKELAEAVSQRDDMTAALEDRLGQRARTESELAELQKENRSGSQFSIYMNYLERMEDEIKNRRKQLAEMEEDVSQRRERLLEAMKKRKALERLKEKGLKAYIADLDHEELKFIDEIAIHRFGPNTK